MEDQFIGINIKQKVKTKMQQMNIDIFSNQTLLQLIVFFYQFIFFFITHLAIPLARDNLLGLVSNWDSNAINKFGRKIRGKGAVRARKGFTLFISNEKTNNNIKIIKSLDDWKVLIDGIT